MSRRLPPILAVLIPAVLSLALCLGCATSSGSLYRDTAEAERRQAESLQKSAPKPEPLQPVQEGLEIESDPDGAAVYLNNRYVGETPLLLESLGPGRYQLRLEREGYYPQDAWIDYAGGHMVFHADLRRIMGFLQVMVEPPEAAVTVGDRAFSSGTVNELPAGLHVIRARLFGFEEYSSQVRIEESALTRLEIKLEPARLRLEDLRSSRPALNPGNPGLLGRARIRFRVSSRGTGRAAVLDSSGSEVWQKALAPFTTWEQAFDWDGAAADGSPLPDGSYTILVEAWPEDGSEGLSAQIPLRLDSTLRLTYRPLWNGASGLLFAPSPEVLPGGGLQASTLFVAHVAPAEGYYFRALWDFGLRVGLATRPGLELDLHGGVILGYGEVVPWFASAAAKLFLGGGWLESAALVKFGYQRVRTDTFANFTGLTLGLPLSIAAGAFSFFLAPELTLSLWEVSYEDPDWPAPAFHAWAYLKAGVVLNLDSFTLGISAAARTLPFDRGLGFQLPVQAGLEAHWMIPGTQAFLTAVLTAEAAEAGSFYLNAGAGLGLLN